jgi:alanine racemase
VTGRGFGLGFGFGFAGTAGTGAGGGVGFTFGPKIRSKIERRGAGAGAASGVVFSTGLAFGGVGTRREASWALAEASGMASETRTAISFCIREVGKTRSFVFLRRALSSLSSKTGTLRCWAEVSPEALRHNLAAMRSRIGGTGVMAIVKANAYGHGTEIVVPALAGRVEMFGVANLAEARATAALAGGTPIFILGAALPAEREAIVSEGFIPAVSSSAEAAAFAAFGKVDVHLAVDTGMGRMGVWLDDAAAAAREIAALPGVTLAGLCSHLASADSDDDFTLGQLAQFESLVARLAADGIRPPLIPIENSAAAIAFPSHAGTLVRAGLALYGVSPLRKFQPEFRPALTLKTRVILVRDFDAGHGVSYGRTFITERRTRVATLAAGYADGYPRQVSGRGAEVLIAGRRCPVLGRVTMDQMMVDVSKTTAAPGDEAVLLGSQGGGEIAATELSGLAGTIAWDVLTGIGPRVERVKTTDDECRG